MAPRNDLLLLGFAAALLILAPACDHETTVRGDTSGDLLDDSQVGGLGYCEPCDRPAECGGALDFCLSVEGEGGETESFCGADCSEDPEGCPTGASCLEVSAGFFQCVPDAGTCVDRCAEANCPPEAICDPNTGQCLARLQLCDVDCAANDQCGEAADLCVRLEASGETICAQDCSADPEGCPEDYVCAQVGTEFRQCVPQSLTCLERCAGVECDPGLTCDPFTGSCRLPLGQCEADCINDDLCGTTEADRCINLGNEEVVCALDCTEDPTVCPFGTYCATLQDGGANCIPNTLTCTDDRCEDIVCGASEVCDPTTGGCIRKLGLCEQPCLNNNACLGPNDICLSFSANEDAFCAQDCEQTGRCPLGYGCFTLQNGGNKCIPTAQTCEFLGADCTYETRFADCPGDEVVCSAVRAGDAGQCVPDCSASPALCTSELPTCVELEVVGTICLPESPYDPETCGRYAPVEDGLGRPCGGAELSPFCPEPNNICYDAAGDDTAPFCTRACASSQDCGDAADCVTVPGQDGPVCVPEACSVCLAEADLGGQDDLLGQALDTLSLTRCDVIISNDAMSLLDVSERRPPGRLPAARALWRHPLGTPDAARDLGEGLDAALGTDSPATDALLKSARGAGLDPAEKTAKVYAVSDTQPLADALTKLITIAGGTPDIAALEADAADVPLALQREIAPLLLVMRDNLAARSAALDDIAPDDGPLSELFANAHGLFLRLPEGATPPNLDQSTPGAFVDGSRFQLDTMTEVAMALTAQLEAADLTPDAGWGSFDFNQPTPIGRVILRGTDADTYDPEADATLAEDIALLVDAGGDDVYRIPAGANTSLANPFALHIDLGGSDTYAYTEVADPGDDGFLPSDADGRYVPTLPLNQEDGPVSLSGAARQGAGRFGVGLLFDLGAGADDYRSLRLSQGFGLFGVGVLYDDGGVDAYTLEAAGQGAAMWGIGLLLDDGVDDDTYRGWHLVQGAAATYAVGVLLDADGGDTYTAVPGRSNGLEVLYYNLYDRARSNLSASQGASIGRGLSLPEGDTDVLAGGLGVLRDANGDDAYTGAVLAQGAGAWFGAGLLLDADGNDTFDVRRYGQGVGLLMGTGLLLDAAGEDRYNTIIDRPNTAQGLGEDLGVGLLIDDAGNDTYTLTNSSGGVGLRNGIGLFADHGGDDTYTLTSSQSLGYAILSPEGSEEGDPRREVLTLGLFIDAEGVDTYGPDGTAPADAADDATWTGNADIQLLRELGAGVDGLGATGL